jgi:hypothetical protein
VEEPVLNPAATASATTANWVRAFAPAQDFGGLAIEGDRTLVETIIAELAQETVQTAARERVEDTETDPLAEQAA